MPRRSRRWARNARPRRCAEPQRRARRERRRTAELWGNCGSAAPCVHHYVSRARTDIMPNRAIAAAARHPSREASSPISYHLCCVRVRARRVEVLVAQHPGTGRGVQGPAAPTEHAHAADGTRLDRDADPSARIENSPTVGLNKTNPKEHNSCVPPRKSSSRVSNSNLTTSSL